MPSPFGMHALVLAAGAGSRLRPYTDERPKPMLEVGGHPIIAYNLAMLAAGGFRDVVINLHHFPEAIRDFVGTGERWGMRVTYSEEPALLGTAGALVPLRERFASDTFAIAFGDNVNDIDVAALRAFHERKRAAATVALAFRPDVSQSGVAELGADDRIVRFIEKPRPGQTDSQWVNAGLVLASPRFLRHVPVQTPSDIGRDVLPPLASEGNVYGYRMDGAHWWFDRSTDYERARDDGELAELAGRLRL